MAKPRPGTAAVKTTASPTPPEIKDPNLLMWPSNPKEVSPVPRLYRIHRVDAFAWQAYVFDPTDPKGERPIGKADLFDIVSFKVKTFQRMEGQVEYLANKTKAALEAERKHDVKTAVAAN